MPIGTKQADHFISAINKHYGPAKANKYQFLGPFGAGMASSIFQSDIFKKTGINLPDEDLKFMCDATNLPGRNLATVEFRTGSVSKSYVHANNFNPTLTLSDRKSVV